MTHLAHQGPEAAPRAMTGILLYLGSILIFTLQDGITAHLARHYPVPFFLMLRYWAFAAFALAFAAGSEGGLAVNARSRRPVMQIVRGGILVFEMGVFAFGLRYLQLAEIHALFAANPLMVTALSVPFLGEVVRWRRWAAVIVGFIGVLIILRPGFGVFQPAALLGIACAAIYAVYTVMTKLVGRTDAFPTTYLYTAGFGALAVSTIGPFFWSQPEPFDWLLIACLCVTGMSGHFMVIKSLDYAPASLLQPLTYFQLVGVAIVGFFFFSEVPDNMTILGAAIVVGSGLYVIWRERKLKTD